MAKKQLDTKEKQRKKQKLLRAALYPCLGVLGIGAACGVVIALSAVSNDTGYIDPTPYKHNANSKNVLDYTSTQERTQWTGELQTKNPEPEPDTYDKSDLQLGNGHPADFTFDDLYGYEVTISSTSDGNVIDKGFSQSCYYGSTYWVHQVDRDSPEHQTGWSYTDPTIKSDPPGFKFDNVVLGKNTPNPHEWSSFNLKPSGDDTKGYLDVYRNIADSRKAVILTGFNHVSPLNEWLKSGGSQAYKHGYILEDGTVWDKNVASLTFKADQAAFLAAIAGCQYLEENWSNIFSQVGDGQLRVGMFGGTTIPTVTCFMGGFELGVWFYNNHILRNTDYYKQADEKEQQKRTIQIIDNGAKSSWFSGTFNVGDARLVSQELLAKGANLILTVSSPQAVDTVTEIYSQKSPCKVIGVDVAQEDSDIGRYVSQSKFQEDKGQKIILCSAEKDMAYMTPLLLQNSATNSRACYIPDEGDGGFVQLANNQTIDNDLSDTEKDTAVGSYGYTTIGSVYNHGVQVSPAGHDYFIRAMQCVGEGFEILTDYDQIIKELCVHPFEIDVGGQIDTKTMIEIIAENQYFIY